VSDKRTINFSNKMPGLALSSQLCPRMERPISPIPQTGPTNHQERDISCETLQDPLSVPAVHLRHLYQESVLLDSLMVWKVTAQRSQRLRRPQGRLLKAFPPARHYKWQNTDSPTATLHTRETGSSRASATSPTSPARARSMLHYLLKRLSKKQTVRPTTMDPFWPGIYQVYTPSTQPHIRHLTQANYTATPMQQRAVLTKTSTRITVSDPRRDRTGRRRHR
jgi:hypothetical protein